MEQLLGLPRLCLGPHFHMFIHQCRCSKYKVIYLFLSPSRSIRKETSFRNSKRLPLRLLYYSIMISSAFISLRNILQWVYYDEQPCNEVSTNMILYLVLRNTPTVLEGKVNQFYEMLTILYLINYVSIPINVTTYLQQ